jgi:ATP-binding cassette, subfamily B, bacterial
MAFPFYKQLGFRDCGPACLKMIALFYGRSLSIDYLRDKCSSVKAGVSMLGISHASEAIGFRSTGVKIEIEKLKKITKTHPCILHWDNNHFIVLYGYKKKIFGQPYFEIADPAKDLLKLSEDELVAHWVGTPSSDNKEKVQGIALILEPTSEFYKKDKAQDEGEKLGLKYLLHYFNPYQRYFFQLILGLLIGTFITLSTPLLTQTLIDKGVNLKSYEIVYLVLAGQLALFMGSLSVEFVRSQILLHIGTRINISMVSDFFQKLFRLPISFFDRHITGDLMQRISDHKRLENLLTVSSLNTLFSGFNIIILTFLLGSYNTTILSIFLIGAVIGFIWTYIFLKWRKQIDYKMFDLQSKENSKVIEVLDCMQEIKISNSGRQKRWEWEDIQASLYKQKISNLNVGQLQSIGGNLFNQATVIAISFFAATSVIEGSITLGGMFAINMIVGQLNSPLQQIYAFINTLQQANIGLNRIGDIVLKDNETQSDFQLIDDIPDNEDIVIKDVSFSYGNGSQEPILKNLNLVIPKGKVTAIVGASGSGKSTLLKILLKFYEPTLGSVCLGDIQFKNLHHDYWREKCGVVMQEGKIFNGTLYDNISAGLYKDIKKILQAGKIANIDTFINSMPMGYMTEVGNTGTQVSVGQKQRFLLARAIYKNPSYLFLDEATSSLDANSEKKVLENLETFFQGRTVLVIAHRLSTVKNADQIVVMENGEIVETGKHEELSLRKGKYYELVKNQLELGN